MNKLKSREQTPEEAVAEMMVEGITTNALTARSYSEDNPKCQNVPGTECQIQKLVNGLDAAVNAGTCPSCGENYQLFFLPELSPEPGRYGPIDGFNSNTWVYNMIRGAGMTPPGMGRAPGYHQAAGAW